MAPREIWCNEAQERYVLAIAPADLESFRDICERERCPFAVVGRATALQRLVVADAQFGNEPVAMELDVLFGKPPRMTRDVARRAVHAAAARSRRRSRCARLRTACCSCRRSPTRRSWSPSATARVGGLCARDPMVGPWQVPVADVAVTLLDFDGYAGEAMAIGERTPIALIDAPASGRMAVAEAITNIAAAGVERLSDIKLSANWMAPAGHPGEDAALYDTVRAVGMELCPALGLSIPVGKDSMSMRTTWRDGGIDKAVTAPVSLIVSAFAPVADARRHQHAAAARSTRARRRCCGSTSATAGTGWVARRSRRSPASSATRRPTSTTRRAWRRSSPRSRTLRRDRLLLAYHDIADGGVFATLVEMAFASRCGLDLVLPAGEARCCPRCSPRSWAPSSRCARATSRPRRCAPAPPASRCTCSGARRWTSASASRRTACACFDESRVDLHRAWSATTHALQRLRDNPEAADQEHDRLQDTTDPGLSPQLGFDPDVDVAAPYVATGVRPAVAILREQGVNGQVEMAAAFDRAGFAAYDVHMSDILAGRRTLTDFAGIVACGGFSYGDVLGAGEGWAKSILFHARARDQFAAFFDRSDVFALGVCNGCQMMSNLHEIIPGTGHWPHFVRNRSEQFEARFVLLEVAATPSLFFHGMEGSRIPVVTAHGEGYAEFRDAAQLAAAQPLVALRQVDNAGRPTERYPYNVNGSPQGITGLTTADGRFTILMPHPERVFRSVQMSWHPECLGRRFAVAADVPQRARLGGLMPAPAARGSGVRYA